MTAVARRLERLGRWLVPAVSVAVLLGGCGRGGASVRSHSEVDRGEVTVSLDREQPERPAIEVSGPSISRRSTVAVYPEYADVSDPSYPSILGAVSHRYHRVRFTPRYPLEPGSRHQIVLSEQSAGSRRFLSRHWVEVPAVEPSPRARVVAIYPSGGELPANQLKLYVEFSAPMRTTSPYDHVTLVDEATGEPLEAVFHQMRDGLWDAEGRRLTVVFDPGRVKRGLANHQAMGLPLSEGRAVRLEISAAWPDALGKPLAEGHAKRFVVTAPDRRRPAVADWSVGGPVAGTLEPVVIAFGEPLDAALLGRSFELLDSRGEPVPMDVRLGPGERSCELWPHQEWTAGDYKLGVDPALEDLAGNNFNRLFDHDLAVDSAAPQRTWLRLPKGETK